ncbi:hypothetical protein ACFODX_01130 [Cellvibrio fontiphilus]|uniref:BACON domain-containing protein n=2 Tax=Cellvibrio fontiphilus TaxID=1815559 RepID=A0ABV7FD52_9GAMM
MATIRLLILFLTAVMLTACGGGGGGGGSGSGGGSGGTAKGSFSLDKSSLAITQRAGEQSNQAIQINITGSDVTYVVAGFDQGQTQVPWLSLYLTGSGSQYSLEVVAQSSGMAAGNYSASFTIATADKNEKPLQKRVVTVSLSVSENFGFAEIAINRYAVTGKPVGNQFAGVWFAGKNNAAWTATASAPWLVINNPTGVGSGELKLGVDTSNLSPGNYTGTIQLAENGNPANSASLQYNLTVVAPLAFGNAPGELVFVAGLSGSEYRAQVPFTGDAQTNWIASTDLPGASIYNAEGSGSGSIEYRLNPSWLSEGTYTGRISLVDKNDFANIAHHNMKITVEAPIQFSELAKTRAQELQANPIVYGSDSMQRTLELPFTAGDHAQWTSISNAHWLSTSNVVGTGSGTLQLQINAAGLPIGTYPAELRLEDYLNPQNQVSLNLTLVVAPPTLTVTSENLLLGGSDGLASPQATLGFAIDTGVNGYDYSVAAQTEANGDWLTIATGSGPGTANNSGIVTGAGVNLNLAPLASLAAGTHRANLALRVEVGDQVLTRSVAVTLNKEASRLVASNLGVAFTAAPSRSLLTRKLKINSSIGRNDIPWSAVSNQSWLSVTSSGLTGGQLVLTANKGALPVGTHIAEVRVSSSDTNVQNQEVIRVGLTVLDVDPTDVNINLVSALTLTDALAGTGRFGIVASPVEPWVYVGLGNQISVYNQFSGALVRSFVPAVGSVASMAISQDGTKLYVHDPVNLKVVELYAETGGVLNRFNVVASEWSSSHVSLMPGYFRPNGRPLLFMSGTRIFDLTTGEQVTVEGGYDSYFYSTSTNQNPNWVAGHDGSLIEYFYSALGGGNGKLTGTVKSSVSYAQGRAGQACVDAAGTRVYTASGAPYEFSGVGIVSQTLEQTLPGTAYPNSIVCGWNGILVGGAGAYYNAQDIFVYNTVTGQNLGNYSSSTENSYRSLLDRGVALSGDNRRVSALSYSDSTKLLLRIFDVPAIP